jgi:hypothetical protein
MGNGKYFNLMRGVRFMKKSEFENLIEMGFKNNISILNMSESIYNKSNHSLIENFYKDGTTIPKMADVDIDNKYISKSFEYVTKSIKVLPYISIEEIINKILNKKIEDENMII